jgi:MFS family permease
MSVTAVEEATPRLSEEYKKKRWGGIAALSVATMSDNAEGGLINTLFPVIMEALNLQLGALGVMSSISRYARMLFGTAWSMVADRIGRKRVLVFVTGIWGLWMAAAGLAQDYTQLLILYSIAVIGTVASEPIMNGLLVDMFEDDERGQAYGAIRTIAVASGLVITPLIGQLANIEDGWRYGLYGMGAISLLSGILIVLFVQEPPKSAASELDPESGTFKLKDVGTILKIPTVLLLAVQLLFVTSLVLFAFFVTYFVQVRGWTTPEAAILNTVFFAGFAIGGFVGGKLGDWFTQRYAARGRIILMQLYLVAFAVMTFLMMQIDWGRGPIVWVVVFVAGLVGSIGFSGCVLPMVGSVVEPKYAATAFALLFSFVQGAITATLLLLIGPLVEALGSLQNVMLWLVSVPYAINAVFWFLFYKPYPRDVERARTRVAAARKV